MTRSDGREADQLRPAEREGILDGVEGAMLVSALDGEGVDALVDRIAAALGFISWKLVEQPSLRLVRRAG